MSLSVIQPTKKNYSMSKLHYEYVKEDRYLYLFDQQNQMIYYTTPILKVYKNLYESNNNYYLVLDLDNEDDVNNDIYNFKSKLDKLYGKSQDEVRKNYKEIFSNSKGIIDNITYETCVKRPYTGSRGQLIKLLIPDDEEDLFQRIENILDGENIRCEMVYKGLKKIQGGRMLEEYILINFITEQEWMSELTRKMLNPYRTNLNINIDHSNDVGLSSLGDDNMLLSESSDKSVKEITKSEEVKKEEEVEREEEVKKEDFINSDDEYEDLMDIISLMDKEEENKNKLNIEFLENSIELSENNMLFSKENNLSSNDNFIDEEKTNHKPLHNNLIISEEKEEKEKKAKKKQKEDKEIIKKEKKKKENEKIEKKKDFHHKMKKINEPEMFDSDTDNLSDNEEFSKLSKKEKEKFRKIYRKMKH